jgi:biopolymer transport protein ExbD
VTISVTDEGTLAWNKDLVTLDEFLIRLQQYHLQEPDGRILINGDERAFFAQAVYVFDEARKAGFLKVYIETRSR